MTEYELYYLHQVNGRLEAIDGTFDSFVAADDGAAEQEALQRLAAERKAHPNEVIYGLDLDADPENCPRRVATLT